MATNYRRDFLKGTKRITTGCQYCAVGCGYNAFLVPRTGLGTKQMDGVSRFITPAMRSQIRFKGVDHDVAVAPDVRCDLNKGNHSVRGGSQGENLVRRDGKGRSTEDRLKSPMVRVRENGSEELKEITWAQLNQLMARLVSKATVMEPEGGKIRVGKPQGLGVKMFEYQYLENTYALTKLFYSAIGTPNVAYHDRPSVAGSSPGLKDAGVRPHDFSYDETLDTDVLVFIGTNPYENQSVYFMQHCVGKKMIVIDPRTTATAKYAEDTGGIHVQPKNLGADSLVLYAIAREIIRDWDAARTEAFPWADRIIADVQTLPDTSDEKRRRRSRALNFADFKAFLEKEKDSQKIYSLENAEQTAGIESGVLRRVVDLLFDPEATSKDAQPRVGMIYEKGMIWGFNYHNTAAVGSLGVLLGAYADPEPDPDPSKPPKFGRFVGRVGGHQKGWAGSFCDLSGTFTSDPPPTDAPPPSPNYSEGYPARNATDVYKDGHLDKAGFPGGIRPEHNIDNHVFGPDVPDGAGDRVELPNGLTTYRNPDVNLLWIIGGNYLGQTNDAQRKLKSLRERRALGGTGGEIALPAQGDDIDKIAKVFEDRIGANGLVLVHQDLFLNPTSELCDVIIPAAGWGEDSFCRYNAQRRLKLFDRFQDPPLHPEDAGRISGDPVDVMDNFAKYQHSPKSDWRIIRDIAREIGTLIDQESDTGGFAKKLAAAFGWADSADVADEMAHHSQRGLASSHPETGDKSMLGDLYLFAHRKIAPGKKIGEVRGVLHELLGARPHVEPPDTNDPVLGQAVYDALAEHLSGDFYSVSGSDSDIYGNTVATNGVFLPVRGLDSANQPVTQTIKVDGKLDPDLIEARADLITKIQGTLRKGADPGTVNFVKAPWSEIEGAFKENLPAAGELAITNGRFNHLWNNLFHHLRNDYVNERYPEDMPGTILEVNPEWAAAQNPVIKSGDIVKVADGTNEFMAVASLQAGVPAHGAFAMFSFPVRNSDGSFNFDGYVNNLTNGYADGINPIAALKYGKAVVTKIGTYQSATRSGPTYEPRNQIQEPPQRGLDLEMRELIVKKGLPRNARHRSVGQDFLSPDLFLEKFSSNEAGLRARFKSALELGMMRWSRGFGLIDEWHQPEIDLAVRWLDAQDSPVPPPPPGGGGQGSVGYEEVKTLLDKSVGGPNATVGFHRAFWRTMTHASFISESVFGERLVAPGDPAASGLLQALRGIAPFDGSSFPRMPAGVHGPMPDADIQIIENWVADGAPEFGSVSGIGVDPAASAQSDDAEHNAYWREFDDWSLFNRTPDIDQAIGRMFGMAATWRAFARGTGSETAWDAAVQNADNVSAVTLLATRQARTVTNHYGAPVRLADLFDSHAKFGSSTLPSDPLRPSEPQHDMNGAGMWFMWSAFTDAVLRLGIEPVFWQENARAILLGALNDGTFRGRFTVNGFSVDPAGSSAMLKFVRSLDGGSITAELAIRYRQSGLDFPAVPPLDPGPGGDDGSGDPPVTDIKEIRILPPLAIARLGQSPEPMHNYDVAADAGGDFRKLEPAETLVVDAVDGSIVQAVTPAEIQFRDSNGLIKPVSPFLELWARFEDNGNFKPLTLDALTALGMTAADINWSVRVANLKMFRRTGDSGDRVTAAATGINHHEQVELRTSPPPANFKADVTISFGSVRFIRPTDEFSEIRLRFVPAQGKVFGHTENGSIIPRENALYDRSRGRWDEHEDGVTANNPTPRARIFTSPSGIFARTAQLVNLGYFDDTCDGIVTAELSVNGTALTAGARISSGPPDFAPDSFPIRTVADDLEQMAAGPQVDEVTADEVIDIVRRAAETVALSSSDALNTSTPFWQPGAIPVFEANGAPSAPYLTTVGIHRGLLDGLQGLKAPANDPRRAAAVGILERISARLRVYDEVGDYSADAAQKMPALMRGADGELLALTRRQRNKIVKAIEVFAPELNPGGTPGDAMRRMVVHFRPFAVLHSQFALGDGRTLADLFDDPVEVMAYLRNENARGSIASNLGVNGDPLVVGGDPDASAIITLVESTTHPMNSQFLNYQDQVNQLNGIEVLMGWISSLT